MLIGRNFLFSALGINYSQHSIDSVRDTLPAFCATYKVGDNGTAEYKIKIYKINKYYFAEKISPVYYYGTKVEGIWNVKLDSDQVKDCLSFIKNLRLPRNQRNDKNTSKIISRNPKLIPPKIQFGSSSNSKHSEIQPKVVSISKSSIRQELTVGLALDTIHINGSDMGFEGLYTQLFYTQLKELNGKEENEYTRLSKQLIGKWYIKSANKRIKLKDTICLSKDNIPNCSECSCIFGDSSFNSNAVTVFGSARFSKYNLTFFDYYNSIGDTINWKVPALYRLIIMKSDGADFFNSVIFSVIELGDSDIKLEVDGIW